MAMRAKKTWWLAPTYQMAAQVWRDLKQTMLTIPDIIVNESLRRIEFPDSNGSIEIRSTHYPDNLRGAGLDFVVLDEAAYMPPYVWHEVVRPMLLETRGGALFLSTPQGRNWFWELYMRGHDPDQIEWASFHFSSWRNPLIAYEEIQQIQETTQERIFREEYEAEFIEDSGAVFRDVQAAAIAPSKPSYQPDQRYVMGVDWGKDRDYTVLTVINSTNNQMVAIERFNQIGYALQRQRLKALAEKWHVSVIWAEQNSIGTPIIEELQREGLYVRPFMTTAQSKAPLIEALALAIENGRLQLLADETLLRELTSYQVERTATGHYRYNAPIGMHDDTVIATALAWHACQKPALRMDFV